MSRPYAFPAPTDVAGSVQRAGLSLNFDTAVQAHFHVHLEVFLMGGQVAVPAGIGIDDRSGAMSPLHTHDDSGIVHIEGSRGQRITLGQLFTEWGQPLGPNSIGNVQSRPGFTIHWFVNGRVVTDPAAVVLQPHDTIVAFETAVPASAVSPPTYAWPSGF